MKFVRTKPVASQQRHAVALEIILNLLIEPQPLLVRELPVPRKGAG
jgi:hypothetical protein